MFKINISTKEGKTYKLETEAEGLKGKELGNKISGSDISPDLEGYELEITGASDKAGFTALKTVEGIGLKKVLLRYGKAMHMKPKGEKKKGSKPKGLKLRKTVRGKVISGAISQINLKVLKDGAKKLDEIFKAKEETPTSPDNDAKPGGGQENAVQEKGGTPAKTSTEQPTEPKPETKAPDASAESQSDNNIPTKGREGGTPPEKSKEKPAEAPPEEKPTPAEKQKEEQEEKELEQPEKEPKQEQPIEKPEEEPKG